MDPPLCCLLSRDTHEIVDDQNHALLSLAAIADTGHQQIRSLETLRGDFQRAADLQARELQRLELELQEFLGREQIDLAQVETRIRRIESLRTEIRLGRIKTVEKGKATLTPEQWRKLQPLIRGGP